MSGKRLLAGTLALIAVVLVPGVSGAHSMGTTGPITLSDWCFLAYEHKEGIVYTSASSDRTWVVAGKLGLTGGDLRQYNVVEWNLKDNATGAIVGLVGHPIHDWVQTAFTEIETITAHTGGTFSLILKMSNLDTNAQCYDRELEISYATAI